MYKILEYLEILEKRIMRYSISFIIVLLSFQSIKSIINSILENVFSDNFILSIVIIASILFLILIATIIDIINKYISTCIKSRKEMKLIKEWWNSQEFQTRMYLEFEYIINSRLNTEEKYFSIKVEHNKSKDYNFDNCKYVSYKQDTKYPEYGVLNYDRRVIKMFDKEKVKLKEAEKSNVDLYKDLKNIQEQIREIKDSKKPKTLNEVLSKYIGMD